MDYSDAYGLAPCDTTYNRAQLRLPNATSGINQPNDESNCYKMNHDNRGMAIIINNKNFHKETGLGVRKGTDNDANSVYELFDILGFERIEQYDDQPVQKMRDCLTAASKIDHKNNACFVCVILSHGVEDSVYGIDKKIAIDDLIRPFKGNNCPSLAGKPKLFLIQACRGSWSDHEVTVANANAVGYGATVADAVAYEKKWLVEVSNIPAEADFLFAYSNVPGFYSGRNQSQGSWFIQNMVDIFKKNWTTMDVLTMMKLVKKRFDDDFQSDTNKGNFGKRRQILLINSVLTKRMLFRAL